ncbi:ABC-2 type transport system ATP-binding protein [Butyrivibrio sp. ob235]|uniref:ABC transporter ATP-binding protein n=1 Tax=Butyrivibrio sp. ob235 TaxID=1761780 RepID=UPI0008BAFB59|nr:ABC transporter ATP-binding protein [Butyrivibrio sp. ob235]SEL83211.1 ABC-2 type transport system ATP-binding protein [Butyrivibrio sp. ob235]
MSCVLKVNNVSRKVKDFQILKNVSFELKRGEIVGLIGPNGAGKTSIMKILVGLTINYTGEVDLSSVRDIGSMIETPNFYPYNTGYQNLMYFAKLNGVGSKKVEELLDLLGLTDAANKNVKGYSLGMRQRLGIAQALLKDPDVLVLDEPTNGLDPQGIYEVREYIRKIATEKNITVLISSHLLGELEKMCNRAIFIKKGEVIQLMDFDNDIQNKKITFVIECLDSEKTQEILAKLGYNVVSYNENEVRVKIGANEKNDIAKILYKHKIVMTGLYEACETLEDTFLELMRA